MQKKRNRKKMNIDELKSNINEDDLLLLYYYIDENEGSFTPEEKVALYNLLCELDQKLLTDDEEE